MNFLFLILRWLIYKKTGLDHRIDIIDYNERLPVLAKYRVYITETYKPNWIGKIFNCEDFKKTYLNSSEEVDWFDVDTDKKVGALKWKELTDKVDALKAKGEFYESK